MPRLAASAIPILLSILAAGIGADAFAAPSSSRTRDSASSSGGGARRILQSSSSSSSSFPGGDVVATTANDGGGGEDAPATVVVGFETQSSSSSSSSSHSSRSSSSEVYSSNDTPPNILRPILDSFSSLKSGSDLRGTYHANDRPHDGGGGTFANIISHLLEEEERGGGGATITPFAAHCLGAAFARWLLLTKSPPKKRGDDYENDDDGRNHTLRICVGRDPRCHGERLCDSFAGGAEGVGGGVVVAYTGLATTPSMYEFVRSGMCDAAVMGECGGPVIFVAFLLRVVRYLHVSHRRLLRPLFPAPTPLPRRPPIETYI